MSEKRKIEEELQESDKDGTKIARICEAGSSTDPNIEINEWNVEEFRKKWELEDAWQDEKLQLLKEPFQLCRLFDFLKDESVIEKLVDEFAVVDFDRRQMDLYEFYQSKDMANFSNSSSTPFLKAFYHKLKSTVMPLMQDLTGTELTHISASISMYNTSDYLLVHDDLMTDRKIAFVFYLSPWKKQWTPEMGGALELFNNKDREPHFPVVEAIPPVNNQFVFFKVCPDSFHQVGEVTSYDYPRLTINGWFHGPITTPVELKIPTLTFDYVSPITWKDTLEAVVNPIYLKNEYKEDIQKQIEDNSEASLEEFLDENFYDQILTQIQAVSNEKWTTQGPANLRNYEVLAAESTPPIIKKLLDLFGSDLFFKLLHEFTELDLFGSNAQNPKCSIEVQRWTQGCYTVLGDPSTYQDSTLDLTFYINAYPQVGVVTYLSPEEENADEMEDEDFNPVLLTIHPKDNALNIVYRSEGTTKFTKYVSKSCLEPGKFTYILSCRYKE